MEKFATRMKRVMFLKGIRQTDLAERTGINKGTLSHYMNGKYMPNSTTVKRLAAELGVSVDYLLGNENMSVSQLTKSEEALVPVLGRVSAGAPSFAAQDVIDKVLFEEDAEGKFALHIRGDSMSPRIVDGDTVIVDSKRVAKDGDLVIAIIEDEATCKVFKPSAWGVSLVPFNPVYQPIVLSPSEADTLHIIGVVIESRHKWSI